jgi:hypothetical protein
MINAIYIRMPRCGSTTIDNLCRKNKIKSFGGWNMGFWGRSTPPKFHIPNTSTKLYKCVMNHIGEKTYDESFIFTTVRNPYSRAVSIYKHHSWDSIKTFSDFCKAIIKNDYPSRSAKWHSSTLTEHIFDKGTLKVDFVMKLENIEEDFNTVCDKIKIPYEEIPHKNKSKHKHYTEYYNYETRGMIEQKYARDIDYFGYKFGE